MFSPNNNTGQKPMYSIQLQSLCVKYFKVKLKNNGDKAPSCLRPFRTGNAKEKCLSERTLLFYNSETYYN
jgi:hypothetical protein